MSTATAARSDFAARLYEKLAAASANRNAFASPLSIEVALAMCAAGAKGATRRALTDLIGASADVDEQNRHYAALIQSIHGPGERPYTLSTANALWGQQGIRLHADYKNVVADFYDGAFNEVNFQTQPDQAVKTINAWVENKTVGKIKELIRRDLIAQDTRLILTNAIYFKGKWAHEFDPSHTWDEDWHGPGGDRKTPMMQQSRSQLYYECPDFQAVDLPYRGEQLSMLIVLPRKHDGLAALERQWAGGGIYQRVTGSLQAEDPVIVSLPRFKIEASYELKPVLSAMGAGLAFSDQADFSGIAAEPLKIAEVVHKAFVEVNEEGTEAAAATGVAMAKCAAVTSEPKVFCADHPFLFVIRDRATNAVLFGGRVVEP